MPKTTALGRRTSPAQEDYVKALHELGTGGSSVGTSQLAEVLDVTPASASEMLVKLAALELVVHDAHRGSQLTPAGRALALEMIRHHRLLETYLVEALGFTWDEVHEEADRLEHWISERMEERMAAALGEPLLDPHGDPIPSRAGALRHAGWRPLTACSAGEEARVARVSDRDPAKLRAVAELGLGPGAEIRVEAESRWEGPITVRSRSRRLQVPLGLARVIFLEA